LNGRNVVDGPESRVTMETSLLLTANLLEGDRLVLAHVASFYREGTGGAV
jgi:hypothetical protein